MSHGWLGLRCPWCGDDDPSHHLGVNPSGYFSCWRDATHKGNTPHKLIAKLLGVSAARARLVTQTYAGATAAEFNAPQAIKTALQPGLSLEQFSLIRRDSVSHKFWVYLEQRGFDDVDSLVSKYQLRACLTGRYSGRLIIPVYDIDNTLVGFQARAITNPVDAPRYLSEGNIKDTLFNLNNLQGGHVVYVTEGPFDCLKMDFYGAPSTCTFGVVPKPQQLNLLRSLRRKYQRMVLLLDNDSPAVQAGFYFSDCIPNVEFGNLPAGTKDPGSLSNQQVQEMLNETQTSGSSTG